MPPPPPPAEREPSTGLLVITGPVCEDDIQALCDRLQTVISTSDARVIVCDVSDLAANCRAIEALARLQLTAQRGNRRIRLQRASRGLEQLLDFAGLTDVITPRRC